MDEELYNYTEDDLVDFMDNALKIVKEAGKMIAEGMGKSKVVIKDFNVTEGHASAVLTETDGAVEKLLVDKLSALYPDHKFIGEEGLGAEMENQLPLSSYGNKPTWIIDPIDGTMNFVHSNPLVVTSVGLAINKKLVLGIVNAPLIGLCYTAIKGKGAFLNGDKPLRVSGVKKLSDAMVIVEMSCGANHARKEVAIANIKELLDSAHAVRSPGPAALDIAWVGAGSADAFFHSGIHCWDIAAGAVIVKEAGGVCLSLDGSEFDLMSRNVLVASSEELALEVSAKVSCNKVDPEYPLPCHAL